MSRYTSTYTCRVQATNCIQYRFYYNIRICICICIEREREYRYNKREISRASISPESVRVGIGVLACLRHPSVSLSFRVDPLTKKAKLSHTLYTQIRKTAVYTGARFVRRSIARTIMSVRYWKTGGNLYEKTLSFSKLKSSKSGIRQSLCHGNQVIKGRLLS